MLGCVGECMLELSHQGEQQYRLAYGGDVFNTATYCARLGAYVGFISAMGDDRHSQWLIQAWRDEGVDVEDVRIIPGAAPSLYTIENDANGEKHFSYWRSASPFRQLFAPGVKYDRFRQRLSRYRALYFSGISLALLPEPDRQLMIEHVQYFRSQGGMVAYDPNYRAKLWPADDARLWNARAYDVADIALPSLEDIGALHGHLDPESALTVAATAAEVVMKCGEDGVALMLNGVEQQHFPLPKAVVPVDTTAAGDAFNAGYLVARLNGQSPPQAVKLGQHTAARVVQHRGAIIPASEW